MTFNELSAATTRVDQVHHQTLLNSKISKEIHDQGETAFCWAFAISSMLRQSLKRYFNTLDLTNPNILSALSKLDKNKFHKRLRMPSMISFRFRPKFEGEAGLSAMFNLHQYIFTSLANTPVKSFFRI